MTMNYISFTECEFSWSSDTRIWREVSANGPQVMPEMRDNKSVPCVTTWGNSEHQAVQKGPQIYRMSPDLLTSSYLISIHSV